MHMLILIFVSNEDYYTCDKNYVGVTLLEGLGIANYKTKDTQRHAVF